MMIKTLFLLCVCVNNCLNKIYEKEHNVWNSVAWNLYNIQAQIVSQATYVQLHLVWTQVSFVYLKAEFGTY